MFRETNAPGMPGGAGLLPAEWLDPDMVASAVRAVGRSVRANLGSYGHPQGFAPLRQQIAASLQNDGVPAHPELNLLTTNGVTHGLDLIARLCEHLGWTLRLQPCEARDANLGWHTARRPRSTPTQAMGGLCRGRCQPWLACCPSTKVDAYPAVVTVRPGAPRAGRSGSHSHQDRPAAGSRSAWSSRTSWKWGSSCL
ncbi:hypothetical protein G6F23_013566 [Rhizopus arrhizus]|nr:hypothetical protein G6F23_013566 [Rhizopus arrhizus]